MKKYVFVLLIALNYFLTADAQKENGIVYSDHDAINKIKAMYAAFTKGDKEAFSQFLTDTVKLIRNGETFKRSGKNLASGLDYWQGFTNLSIKDETSEGPDAIQYKKTGLWVYDRTRITGTHKNSGIAVNLPSANAYHFNKEGKIDTWVQYLNTEVLSEINRSNRTTENGVVYINHPYITIVRKCVNAYCAEDIDALKTFYSSKAIFWKSDFKAGKTINLEEKIKEDKTVFADCDNISLRQVGYPDCIYYAKEDNYIVYSWWNLSFTNKDGRQKKEIPVLITSGFDKDGKINSEFIWLSSNHFE